MKKSPIVTFVLLFGLLTCYAFYSTDENTGNKPQTTYRVGSAKITVLENVHKTEKGEMVFTNYKVEKVYKKEGEWKTTDSFDEKELKDLKSAIDKALTGVQENN